jgi:hypothetical protein
LRHEKIIGGVFMIKRGCLNPEAVEFSKKYFTEGITLRQLRLMSFVEYLSKNWGKIEPTMQGALTVNDEEREELKAWSKNGWINFKKHSYKYGTGDSEHYKLGYKITYPNKEFYDFMNGVLWLTYVEKE